jgi:ribose transport system permease protein
MPKTLSGDLRPEWSPALIAPKSLSRDTLRRWAPLLVLVLLVAILAVLSPNFLSVQNFARMGIAAAPALLVAVGVTFIIIMGSIDLSMEGTVAVCAVVFAFALNWLGGTVAGPGMLAIPLCLLVGAVLGLVNGLVHVKLRIPSFMASLSVGFIGIGIAMVMTGGERVQIHDDLFRALLTVRFLGFPLMVYLALLGLLAAWFIQSQTTIGRNFYAVGGGEDLAHASGLNVGRVRVIGFMIAGMFFALGAMLAVARIGIAETASGSNLMFVAITSVVVGGTALVGGGGGVWNTLIGVLIVNVINNGMIIMGLPRYVQDGVLGAIVIVAVILSTDRRSIGFVK